MSNDILLLFPINGDVLHALDGNVIENRLQTTASLKTAPGQQLLYNGVEMTEEMGVYKCPLQLNDYKNEITVFNKTLNQQLKLTAYFVKNFVGGTRVSIDDNIRFLQDIAANVESYKSIFENPYLAGLKKIHDEYGTKFHFNLFYETEQGDFNLSQMPDKFKKEWQEQKDWMRMSFHAYGEFPDEPYLTASYEKVKQDCELIQNEIKRFAGAPLLGPVTTIHWGACNKDGSKAMRDCGYKGQLGYFNVDDDQYPVSYYLDVEQRRHMKKRFIWKDEDQDVIFIRSSIVLDKTNLKDIVPKLDAYATAQSGIPPYADFLIHEQYFYPDYLNYEADYMQRIETAVKWAHEKGYRPAFLDECIFS